MTNSSATKFTILQTTDIHCQIHPHDEFFLENSKPQFRKAGGYAHLKTKVEELRRENPNTFLVDTGDMFQGSMLSVLTEGEALVPIINEMNYDFVVPGNWEVVYKKEQMISLLSALNTPVICANMYHDNGNGSKEDLIFQPYHILNIEDLKVGCIGFNDPLTGKRQSPDYSTGIIYTKPEDELPELLKTLREEEQCSVILVFGHLGLSQEIHLSNHKSAEGVDYILGADTHERVRKPIEGKQCKVVEPGAFGSFIGKLDLEVSNGELSDSYSLIEVKAEEITPNEEMLKIIDKVEEPHRKEINKIIGYSQTPLMRYYVIENSIDTLVTDALKRKFPEIDIVISNGFRFCPPNITTNEDGLIPITRGYLYDMLPVDSFTKTGKVTGKQIQEWFEKELHNVFAEDASERFGGWLIKFKGMHAEFEAFGEKGKRIQKIEINGKALNPDDEYTILACEREGDPDDQLCRFEHVKNAEKNSVTLHDAVMEYLANFEAVECEPRGNAVATDADPKLLTQVTGVDYEFR